MQQKVTCPNCDTEILVEDPRLQDIATCSNCRHGYRVEWNDVEEDYRLVAMEPREFTTEIDTEKI